MYAQANINRNRFRVLLANLPWQKEGRWGVRAGSRWPHTKDESEGGYMPFPFFLAYATALLEKNNFNAMVIDAVAERMPEESFLQKISSLKPDYLVAETSIPSFHDDLRMLEEINNLGISVILCGPNSLIYDPHFLERYPFIDFVMYGEYEFTLLDLVSCLKENKSLSSVKGLIYRENGKTTKNQKREISDINLLPWPHRESLPMEKYLDAPGEMPTPSVQMLASRGCPFGCNFCLWPQVIYQGIHYLVRDVKDVADEMEFLIKDKKFKSVYFDDDTWNIGKERILNLCSEIKKRNLHHTPWAVMGRADLMDRELLTELKSAGLWAIKYGVESGAQSLVEKSSKNMKLKKTFEMIKLTKSLGIKVHLTFCFGLPGETKETIRESIKQALHLNPDSVQFSILTPFPGTKIFEELESQGRILTRDWSMYDGHHSCVFQPDSLSPSELEVAKLRAYLLWDDYHRKRNFMQNLKRFRDYARNKGIFYALYKSLGFFKFLLVSKMKSPEIWKII